MDAPALDKQYANIRGLVERYRKLARVYTELGHSRKAVVTIRLGLEAKIKAEPDFEDTAREILQDLACFEQAPTSPERIAEAIQLLDLAANRTAKDTEDA